MSEIKPVAWMSMDTPPKEEDGTVLVWAENMPVSMGCCEDGYYVFTECEDLHNYFEGNEVWLTEHWTLWMHLPDPSGKAVLSQAEQTVSRGEIIDVLTATTGLSEGVTADAILAAMRSEK